MSSAAMLRQLKESMDVLPLQAAEVWPVYGAYLLLPPEHCWGPPEPGGVLRASPGVRSLLLRRLASLFPAWEVRGCPPIQPAALRPSHAGLPDRSWAPKSALRPSSRVVGMPMCVCGAVSAW